MMAGDTYHFDYLINESQSLLTRLAQLKPFSLTMPMVKGASVSGRALHEITGLLEKSKNSLHSSIAKFIQQLSEEKQNQRNDIEHLHQQFAIKKLRYNSILDQLDIFADVLSQRSEHEVGVWLSGLDVLAEDGLEVCKNYFNVPALMVFLERGHGAAIRRARTRLPGGDENPVAVIQIPRERMVGSGIASSLIHEVGHQAAESLGLTKSLRTVLGEKKKTAENTTAWHYYERWISEVIADCWAMGHLGIAATLGLMGVVTLPKYFQFRLDLDDPHPAPYVRVKLSCVFGNKLYPHPQWQKIWNVWKTFYPLQDIPEEKKQVLRQLQETEDEFAEAILNHRPEALNGKTIAELFPFRERQPALLQQLFQQWKTNHKVLDKASPTMVFAVTGQAKHDLAITAGEENKLLTARLLNWAYNRN